MKLYAFFLLLALGARSGFVESSAPEYDVKAATTLAYKRGCLSCHSLTKKVVGPSFEAIATKYAKDKLSVMQAAEFIKLGGKGVWGPIPMPPTPKLTATEALLLANWSVNAGGQGYCAHPVVTDIH